MKKYVLVAAFAAVLAFSSAPSAFAQDPFTKLGRGAANLLTGWVEIPKTSYATSQEHNPFYGLTVGILQGAGKGIVRTVGGAYEMVSFPFPLPANYAPVSDPEYVF